MPDDKSSQTIPENNTAATTTPVQPASSVVTVSANELEPVASRKNSKKLLLILTALFVVVFTGGAALAYAVINKPENVLADALQKSLAAKTVKLEGQANITNKDESSKTTLKFTGEVAENAGQINIQAEIGAVPATFTASGSLISAKNGDSYIKIDRAKQIVQNLAGGFGGSMPGLEEALMPLVQKIDNKWIKLTPEDAAITGEEPSECATKLSSLELSPADQDKIVAAFRKNMFVVVKEVLKDEVINKKDSFHYKVGLDTAKAALFVQEVKSMNAFKDVQSCFAQDADTKKELDAQLKNNPPTVEIWADKWTHEPTQLLVTSVEAGTTTKGVVRTLFNQPVKVDIPTKDITTVKELQAELEKIFSPTTTLPTDFMPLQQ